MTEAERDQWLGYMREFEALFARRAQAGVLGTMTELCDDAAVFFERMTQTAPTKFEHDQCAYRAGMWARRARELRKGRTNHLFGD